MSARGEKTRPWLSGSGISLESPFLNEELYTDDASSAWEPRIATLQKQSPFDTPFEKASQVVPPDIEAEQAAAVEEGLDETLDEIEAAAEEPNSRAESVDIEAEDAVREEVEAPGPTEEPHGEFDAEDEELEGLDLDADQKEGESPGNEKTNWAQTVLLKIHGDRLGIDAQYAPGVKLTVRRVVDLSKTARIEADVSGTREAGVVVEQQAAIHGPVLVTPPYGGYDLRRGDHDATPGKPPVWGGLPRLAAAGDVMPPPGALGFVRQLQENLRTLGFGIIGRPDGSFGRRTEWAVREMQVYSKMPFVAQESGRGTRYVDRLVHAPNSQIYAGPVSGRTNAGTRSRLQHWLSSNWRCPVIVEAWRMRGGARDTLHSENIWLPDEVADTGPRMFVRDFSGYYTFPVGRDPNDLHVLGDFARYGRWEGPKSVPPHHTWSDVLAAPEDAARTELMPGGLTGTPLESMTPAQRSTYKVVRAVSEVECIGHFDTVNSYDNAFVSVGPCHWTLGIAHAGGTVDEGELCGYLALLRHLDPTDFRHAFEFFGMRVDEDWLDGTGTPNGASLFIRGQRKYAGWIAVQDETGAFTRVPRRENEGNYFKTWHWFYRFVMAGRTVQGYRRHMWDMARIRLRDLRAAPFPAGSVPSVPIAGGGIRRATLADVFTSERAMGLLLRWHVRLPSAVIGGGDVGRRVCSAVRRAGITAASADPTTWSDAQERALIQGIMDEVGTAHYRETMEYVRDWPRWAAHGAENPRQFALSPTVRNLEDTRNSFQFDGAGLPPAPYA